jgi:prepilin-type N-terminal cleavage/methylation domain-containing protein
MKNNKGFTLIEVVISFCILAIIFSAVLTAVLSFSHQLVQSNELKRNVDNLFSDIQKETAPSKSDKKLSFRVRDKDYEQDIKLYKKSVDKTTILFERFGAMINYEPSSDTPETEPTTHLDKIDNHQVDFSLITYTVYDRIQFIHCVREDGSKLDQGAYVSGKRYRLGDYVTYNNDVYLKVAKTGDWVVNAKSNSYSGSKIVEKQVNDSLAPGNSLSGWQKMYPGFDPYSTYLKGDLIVNHTPGLIEQILTWINKRTLNLDIIDKFLRVFGSESIYCCDLKYSDTDVDAVGYSGRSNPYDAHGYSWTMVGQYRYSKDNSTKQQYKDWRTKYLKNSEIYG